MQFDPAARAHIRYREPQRTTVMQLLRTPGGDGGTTGLHVPDTVPGPNGAQCLEIAARFLAAARAGTRDDQAVDDLASLDPVVLATALADPGQRLAFWINVYNGAVRARLLRDPDAYRRRWRFFETPAVTVAGHVLSANAIEHGILRRSAMVLGLGYVQNPFPSWFERLQRVERLDPRVHFALNCGARSCPPFAAWDSRDLDAQLDAAAATYLRGETAVLRGGTEVRVPRLLLWYRGTSGVGRASSACSGSTRSSITGRRHRSASATTTGRSTSSLRRGSHQGTSTGRQDRWRPGTH